MRRTAILVDGGFYRKRANRLFGKKTPEERADELMEYCYRHNMKIQNDYLKHYLQKEKLLYGWESYLITI